MKIKAAISIAAAGVACTLWGVGVAEWDFSRSKADCVTGLQAEPAGNAALLQGDRFDNRNAKDNQGVYLRVNDAPVLTGHDNGKQGLRSINIRVRFLPETSGAQAVLVRKDDRNIDYGYQLFINPAGQVGLRIKNLDGKTITVTSKNKVATGEWNTVDATADTERSPYNLQIRLNGVVTRASGKLTRLSDTAGPLVIGGLERKAGHSGQYFTGRISTLAISDVTRALDEPGIADPAPAEMSGRNLTGQPGFERMEFVYTEPPTPECHAASIIDLGNGELLATWFGGTTEGHIDVGVWTARYADNAWQPPVETAQRLVIDGTIYPLWNPLLFRHSSGKIFLFYKYGLIDNGLWNAFMTSDDGGRTWSDPVYPGKQFHGPSKNKPVELADGTIYCPAGGEKMELTRDLGKSWEIVAMPKTELKGVIQPAILRHKNGVLQALYRTMGEKKIAANWSRDNGKSWSKAEPIDLPSNNSGFDAVELADGAFLLVYNHAETPDGRWGGKRTPLNVALSKDGILWEPALVLEEEAGEFSYPSVIRAADGNIHIIYTWNRVRLKHVVLDPAQLKRNAQ